MYQVLLADDEALARNDVKSMLEWEKHGFTICGEAHNGHAALALMEERVPHIAILDVSMPSMNGLELCGKIRERYPRVKMIMLSSYDDYDYVRDCLKHGAMDYVLKHRLSPDTLLSLLKKAAQALQLEEREHEARHAQTQIMEQLSPVIHREYAASLAREAQAGGDELQTYAQGHELYADAVTFGAAAVQIVPFRLLTEAMTDVQKNRWVQRATEVMQMAVGDIHRRTVGYAGEGRFIVLFSSPERSEHAVATQIRQAMSSLSHSLEKFLNLSCIYAAGPLCRSLKQVKASYTQASEEIHGQLYPDSGTAGQREPLLLEEQKQLQLFLEQLDGERIQQALAAMFASQRSQPVYAMNVQTMVCDMLRMAEAALKRQLPLETIEQSELLAPRSELGRMTGMAELERGLAAYYARVVEGLRKQQAGGGAYSRHVAKAVQFIADNYASNISLDITAQALNLNASYLSRLFKEETQMTFTEYLNRVRIKTSCLLMESSPHSLKQISGLAGFVNYPYFFKVFKAITGMTPQAYIDHLKQVK
ncbi:two-component system, response regulator YesN [Paenibacillus sp. UNCCL117]|uniref:response regulator transcription factor n=1 Tax=unclassified Paenibacillus TaxID=185978 RepID=UPI0008898E71|nr:MULTISPECIES: response regulator [unclassified Paenibacillus]SDD07658.1 two-component system, response regulator YesN [Paenibacillus sp. cl123]SFW31404.1 two-component system, response regulator YesN [Paenibacillus sp. UNCCL117]